MSEHSQDLPQPDPVAAVTAAAAARSGSDLNLPGPLIAAKWRLGTAAAGLLRFAVTAAGPGLAAFAPSGCLPAAALVATAADHPAEMCLAAACFDLRLHRPGRQQKAEAAVAAGCSS